MRIWNTPLSAMLYSGFWSDLSESELGSTLFIWGRAERNGLLESELYGHLREITDTGAEVGFLKIFNFNCYFVISTKSSDLDFNLDGDRNDFSGSWCCKKKSMRPDTDLKRCSKQPETKDPAYDYKRKSLNQSSGDGVNWNTILGTKLSLHCASAGLSVMFYFSCKADVDKCLLCSLPPTPPPPQPLSYCWRKSLSFLAAILHF